MQTNIRLFVDGYHNLLPEGVDFADSFILGWERNQSDFVISLELSLWPASPHYQQPPKEDFTCYKKGKLHFYGLKRLHGYLPLNKVRPSQDPDGEKDWGSIYEMKKIKNRVSFTTEFTEISLECEGLYLRLDSP